MDQKQAITVILQKLNTTDVPSVVGLGESGLSRVKDIFLRDANKATAEYMKTHNTEQFLELIHGMHAYGKLNDDEFKKFINIFSEES